MEREEALRQVFMFIKGKAPQHVVGEFKSFGGYCTLVKKNEFSITLFMWNKSKQTRNVRFLLVGDAVSPYGFGTWLKNKNYTIDIGTDGVCWPRKDDEDAPANNIGNVYYYETNVKWEALNDDGKKKALEVYKKIIESLEAVNAFEFSGPNKKKAKKNQTPETKTLPYNWIVFGAPGTGKSNRLERRRVNTWVKKTDGGRIIGDEKPQPDGAAQFFEDGKFDRVTFYPTYSYAQFVGTYKPVVDDKKEISYKFVPGPFLRLLSEALKNPKSNYLLIIEEINRANAAAVFGDMFQLLDRKSGGESGGLSEYGISLSEDIKKWFKDDARVTPIAGGTGDKEVAWNGDKLRLPTNFYIWATMNSADQGVFPLDTAFKRRWEFEYIKVDGIGPKLWIETDLGAYFWDGLRKVINDKLINAGKVNEDKLLGPWFLKDEGSERISAEKFSSKVLMYLWEDAARMCRRQFFSDKIVMLSDLMYKWSKASGCPGEEGETLTETFRFEGVKGLRFRTKVSNGMVGHEIKIEVKKEDDGSIQKNDDGNPLFTVTFNEETIEKGKAYSEDWTEDGKVILNIDCDKCYGKIEYPLGEKDSANPPQPNGGTDDAGTDPQSAGDAGGEAVVPAAHDEGGKDDTDGEPPTA